MTHASATLPDHTGETATVAGPPAERLSVTVKMLLGAIGIAVAGYAAAYLTAGTVELPGVVAQVIGVG